MNWNAIKKNWILVHTLYTDYWLRFFCKMEHKQFQFWESDPFLDVLFLLGYIPYLKKWFRIEVK